MALTEHTKSQYNFESIPEGEWDIPELPWMSPAITHTLISTFKGSKAPGLDTITGTMLKNFPDTVIHRLINIYEACWFSGYTPKRWLTSKTVFIPKAGKDPSSVKSQRPIGLLSILHKLFEKLVDRFLKLGPLIENPFHRTQHGFRNGFSCDTALHSIVNTLERNKKNRMISVLMFLDVEGAFDNVNPFKVA